MTDPTETASRIVALAHDITLAAEALDRNDWPALQKVAEEIARQARVLQVMEKET